MPLSVGDAEPARCVGGVDLPRLREPVTGIQVQPTAPWASEQNASVIVRRDLFDMAVPHVVVVATEVATSRIHGHEDSAWVSGHAAISASFRDPLVQT